MGDCYMKGSWPAKRKIKKLVGDVCKHRTLQRTFWKARQDIGMMSLRYSKALHILAKGVRQVPLINDWSSDAGLVHIRPEDAMAVQPMRIQILILETTHTFWRPNPNSLRLALGLGCESAPRTVLRHNVRAIQSGTKALRPKRFTYSLKTQDRSHTQQWQCRNCSRTYWLKDPTPLRDDQEVNVIL